MAGGAVVGGANTNQTPQHIDGGWAGLFLDTMLLFFFVLTGETFPAEVERWEKKK